MPGILNLTQHIATQAQIDAGVVEPTETTKARVKALLTIPMTQPDGLGFAQLSPDTQRAELERRAHDLTILASEYQASVVRNALRTADTDDLTDFQALRTLEQAQGVQIMVGGFQPLMDVLVPALKRRGMQPVVALSERTVKEATQPDGTISKTAVFEHLGFYAL